MIIIKYITIATTLIVCLLVTSFTDTPVEANPIIYIEAPSGGGTIALSDCQFTQGGSGSTGIVGATNTLTSTIVDGDLLFLTTCVDTNGGTHALQTPIGGSGSAWTQITLLETATDPAFGAWYKQAATEGVNPTYTVSWTGIDRGQVMVCKITGHNTSSPQTDAIATNAGVSATLVANQITVSGGALALFTACFDGNANETLTCPTGFSSPGTCRTLPDASTGGIISGVIWETQTGTAGPHSYLAFDAASLSTSDQYNTLSVSFNDAP